MHYRLAQLSDADKITQLVQRTIAEVYPRYYPKEVVDFFSKIHCRDNIAKDIEKQNVYVLEDNGNIIGTGSCEENHISRVYVLPQYQNRGYGSYVLKEFENEICKNYGSAIIEASLPACKFYENHGYKTARHEEWQCDNGAFLVYDVMEKKLNNKTKDKLHIEDKIFNRDILVNYEFRNIKASEASQAAVIEQICFSADEACSERDMRNRIAAAPDLFLVAADKATGKIAGFLNGLATDECRFRDEFFTDASLHNSDGRNIMLLGLDVLPEYRGQGLARELVAHYMQREREKGRQELFLTCAGDKVEMYRKFGFTDLGISASTWGGREWHEMSCGIEKYKSEPLEKRITINLNELQLKDVQPSQFYISEKKLQDVECWFNPVDLSTFNPIPIKLLDGCPVMTDGHTRAVVAIRAGLDAVPLVWDNDELDWEMYRKCVEECRKRHIFSPNDLMQQIISESDYKVKWDKWCDMMQKALIY